MRSSRSSSVRGGRAASSCLTIAERSTSWRNPVWPGERSATEAPTQTIATPSAPPRRSPPAESSSRNGVNRIPPRMNEPATSAANCSSTAPSTAPMSPATGVHLEPDAAVQQVRREAGADVGAGREPDEGERAEDETAPQPGDR